MLEECGEELEKETEELSQQETRVKSISEEINEIQEEIERLSMAGGDENVQLRMKYAVRQSELTSSRKEIHELLIGSLPFVVACVPENLDSWGIRELIRSKEDLERAAEKMEFLKAALEKSGVGADSKERVIEAGASISDDETKEVSDSFLSPLSKEALESIESSHSKLGISHGMVESREALESSILRLEAFERTEDALREATAGSGIGEKAESLRELATELGSAQAEVARLKGVVEQCRITSQTRVDPKLKQNDDPGSVLNRLSPE